MADGKLALSNPELLAMRDYCGTYEEALLRLGGAGFTDLKTRALMVRLEDTLRELDAYLRYGTGML